MALVVYACLHVTRSTGALIGVVHTSACPVGDATQYGDGLGGKRGGVPPFGPSA